MQVLKFGGTSVANADSISKVISISRKALLIDKTIVVVSAMGGVTDILIEAGQMAAAHNHDYKNKLKNFENRHLEVLHELLSVEKQDALINIVNEKCKELESICEAVFLLR